MRARRGRQGERGSITPLIWMIAMVTFMLFLGAAAIGRKVAAFNDAQQMADAAAMAAVDAVREHGRLSDPAGVIALGKRNARATNVTVERSSLVEVGGAGDAVGQMVATATATVTIDVPAFLFGGDSQLTATATAKADIEQERRSVAESHTPRITLVLDYSGSMHVGNAITIQEDAIREHMLEDEDFLDLGMAAVLFDTEIVNSVNFDNEIEKPLPTPPLEEPETVVDTIREFFDQYTANSGTMTNKALDRAREIILDAPSPDQQFVIVASDGGPNDLAAAQEAAEQLWDETSATIMALHVNVNGDPGAENFMKYIAGEAGNRHDETYYYPVADLTEFEEALQVILSQILCQVAPLTADAIKDKASVRVFLETPGGGAEQRLPYFENLRENEETPGYQFDPDTLKISLTDAACDMVRDGGWRVLARYNRGELIKE